MTAHNVIPLRRDPLDRGTLPMPVIKEMIERQNAHDAHYRAMFDAEQGYDFVDPLPRDDMPRFANIRDGGNMPDPVDRPGWAIWACIALGAFAWPVLAWGVAAIIQGAGQ